MFRGLGAGFWNLEGQTEKTAKEWGKNDVKKARNGLKKVGPITDSWETHGTVLSSLSLHAHNCLSVWTTETTNFELATRIPMFVVAPPSLGGNFAKGVVVPAVVESVDLMVTLADLVRSPCLSWISCPSYTYKTCMSGFLAAKTISNR